MTRKKYKLMQGRVQEIIAKKENGPGGWREVSLFFFPHPPPPHAPPTLLSPLTHSPMMMDSHSPWAFCVCLLLNRGLAMAWSNASSSPSPPLPTSAPSLIADALFIHFGFYDDETCISLCPVIFSGWRGTGDGTLGAGHYLFLISLRSSFVPLFPLTPASPGVRGTRPNVF